MLPSSYALSDRDARTSHCRRVFNFDTLTKHQTALQFKHKYLFCSCYKTMFLLAELKDTVRIPPESFHLKLIDAVKDEINRKLANKVQMRTFQFQIQIALTDRRFSWEIPFTLGSFECRSVHRSEGYHSSWRLNYIAGRRSITHRDFISIHCVSPACWRHHNRQNT